ncbi:MAG: BMP family ABC transporter substrate-binding protein [Firmicutes bacterium]|nr:BMP family ABC transporter substrate-binding protein [Bacillota bacterium]
MKKSLLISLLLFSLLISFSGCGRHSAPSSTSTSKVPVIGMVLDKGGLGDESFNDSAYRGLKKAEKKFGNKMGVKLLESHSSADYYPNLQALAQSGCSIIFAVGYLMTDAVKQVAPQFPNTKFAIIDGVIPNLPNVASLTFKEQESSFLAGFLAGSMTRTKTVGFIGGEKSWLIKKFEAGYKAGVETANPKVRILVGFTGSFSNPSIGEEMALAQFSEGADIIYHAAGACGIGVIAAAKKKGKGYFAIGVDEDQDGLAPGRVLTSAEKHVNVAVYDTIQSFMKGKFTPGIHKYGLKNGGVGLSPMEYTKKDIPPKVLKLLAVYTKAISAGKIVVPETLSELKKFHPERLSLEKLTKEKSNSKKAKS